jgi:hypothetical protein
MNGKRKPVKSFSLFFSSNFKVQTGLWKITCFD